MLSTTETVTAVVTPERATPSSKVDTRMAGVGQSTNLDTLFPSQRQRLSADSARSSSDVSELSFQSDEFSLSHTQTSTRTNSNAFIHPPSNWRQTLQNLYIANYGALLVLASQFFGSLMNLSTRILETPGPHGDPMHPFQILFTRQSITALICTAYALWTKSIPHFPLGPPGTVRWLLVCRGLLGFFGVFGLYFSLVYLPLSEATVLTFLAPILTCYACSILMTGETFSKQQQMAGFVSLLGVVFIARPTSLFASPSTPPPTSGPDGESTTSPTNQNSTQPTPAQHLLAIGIAMIGVLGATGAMTSIRAIGTRAHPFISINYFSVWSTIVCLIALIASPDVSFRLPANLQEWGLLAILGSCGFILQSLLTMGLSYGGPSNAEPGRPKDEDIELQHTHSLPADAQTETISTHEPGLALSSVHSSTTKGVSVPKASGTKATAMVYTQMLFALVGDKLVFNITPSFWSWIGSGLILAGAVWVAAARDGTPKTGAADLVRKADASASASVSASASASASGSGCAMEVPGREEEVGLLKNIDDEEADDGQALR